MREIKTAQKPIAKNSEYPITKIVTLAEKISPQPNNSNTSQPNTIGGGIRREPPFRRWTDSKLQARRDKDLCYRCDEPFSEGHRCKNKELRLYLVADDLEDTVMEDIENKGTKVEVSPVVELSVNSVVGLMAPGTFKIKARWKTERLWL